MMAKLRLEVLIPVHNGAEELEITLASLKALRDRFADTLEILLIVGLNACTDSSKQIAESWGPLRLLELSQPSKWFTLNALVEASAAPWVVLLDVGTVWGPEILEGFLRHAALCDAYLPTYGLYRRSMIEHLHWTLERRLKALEQRAGGPLSHHGATAFYKTALLKTALNSLKGEGLEFFNDDVIIPCAIKATTPSAKFFYDTAVSVQDAVTPDKSGDSDGDSGFKRRYRMSFGNAQILQWALRTSSFSLMLKVVLMRRMLRALWAYILMGLLVYIFGLRLAAVVSILLLQVPKLRGAFQASLSAPLLFIQLWVNPKKTLSSWR